ncbi:MAG: pentapeptide repeat-containing protein, partial [Prochlorotrichaceae cyanobacterium]
ANLTGANLSGAELIGANFFGMNYDSSTIFPSGFSLENQ